MENNTEPSQSLLDKQRQQMQAIILRNLPLEEQRLKIREWLLTNVAGQQMWHPAITSQINLNPKGIKHYLHNTSVEPERQFHALCQMPQLLVGARYSHYKADNHLPPRKGVGVHVLYADCELDQVAYQVWLRVKVTPEGLYFYDLGVVR